MIKARTLLRRLTPKSIRAKFILVLLPPVILATGLVSGIFGWIAYEHMEAEIEAKRQILARSHGAALASPMWNFDRQNIQRILDMLLLDPDVAAATVLDERGRIIASAGPAPEGPPDPALMVREPVLQAGGPQDFTLGELRIRLQRGRLGDTITEIMVRDSLLMALLVIAVVGSAMAANRAIVGRPLERLLGAIEHARDHRPPEPVDWPTEDEMGQVIAAYDRMQARLAEEGEKLRHSQANLAEAQRIAQLGSWEWTVGADHHVWSDQMYRMFGAEPRSYNATFEAYMAHVHPDDRDRVRDAMDRAVEFGEHFSLDHRLVMADGSDKAVLEQAEVTLDGEGRPHTIRGTVQDVTDLKRAERNLRSTLDELVRSNAELERFAYVASHDLQEPVRTVTTYSQLLMRRYGNGLEGEAGDYVGYIVSGAQRMGDLVRDLLSYSRASARHESFIPVDLGLALSMAIDNLQETVDAAGAHIEWGSLPTVRGDEIQLIELFQNLINNSIKFRRPDVTPEISVQAQRTSNNWEIQVIDNGIGIEDIYRDQVFVIFKRLHAIDTYPGTGIGLAICKRVVERHGGRIWLKSMPGQGATFCFTLPAPGP